MMAPPIVNSLDLRDGWTVDVSTIHNGRFAETCCFVMLNGVRPRGGEVSWLDIRKMSDGHMDTTVAVHEVLRQMLAANDGGELTLEIIMEALARFDGAWCEKCSMVDRWPHDYDECQEESE